MIVLSFKFNLAYPVRLNKKMKEFLLQLILLLRILSFAYGAPPHVQNHGRIMSAIRSGNLNDFNQEVLNNPDRFRKFRSYYLVLALRLWTRCDPEVSYEREAICDILLDRIFKKNPKGEIYSPLICAVLTNDKRAVSKAIRFGADVNGLNKRGETALIVAIRSGSLEAAEELFEHGMVSDNVAVKNKTALHFACELRNPNLREQAIMLLLNNGVKVSVMQMPYRIIYESVNFQKVYDEPDLSVEFNADEFMLRRMEIEIQDLSKILMVLFFVCMTYGLISQVK